MRALLLHNPTATTTSPALVGLIAKALAADVKLDVEATKRRGHASYLAAGAVQEGYDVVVVLGGDGTVNEAVQGVAGAPVRLGIIPGGSTNVYARILGFPNDAVDATNLLRPALRHGTSRTVRLGQVDDRLFAFHLGFGFDAEVVRAVERRSRLKHTAGQATFLGCGVMAHFGAFDRRARLRVEAPGHEPVADLRTVVCCNADPFTFLGRRPVRLCPAAELDGGLDVLATTKMSSLALLRLMRAAVAHGGDPTGLPFTRNWHDLARAEIVADRPMPVQVDGDFIGEHTRLTLSIAEQTLAVIPAPSSG